MHEQHEVRGIRSLRAILRFHQATLRMLGAHDGLPSERELRQMWERARIPADFIAGYLEATRDYRQYWITSGWRTNHLSFTWAWADATIELQLNPAASRYGVSIRCSPGHGYPDLREYADHYSDS